MVELHKIRQQQSSRLKMGPLLCKLSQQEQITTLGMVLDVLRTQKTVGELLLRGKVWVEQPKMPANKNPNGISQVLQWWIGTPHLMSMKSLFSQS